MEWIKKIVEAALKDDKALCRLTFLMVMMVACGFDLPWAFGQLRGMWSGVARAAAVEVGCAQPAPTPWTTGTSGQ